MWHESRFCFHYARFTYHWEQLKMKLIKKKIEMSVVACFSTLIHSVCKKKNNVWLMQQFY